MCGYSQMAKDIRHARQGEDLVSTLFQHAKGFAAPHDLSIAVCVRKPAKLVVGELPQNFNTKREIPTFIVPCATVIFVPDNGDASRQDKIFSEDGTQSVLVETLPKGIKVTVLSLEVEVPKPPPATTNTRVRNRIGVLIGSIIGG